MNSLSEMFNKKEENANFSFIGTDIHSHLLPGIDDGSENIEASVNMILKFKELGYSKLITTPHIMSDRFKNTPEIILRKLEIVRNELKKRAIEMELEAAAEHYLDDGFIEMIKSKTAMTFGDNYVLFELPHYSEPPTYLNDVIFEMQLAGYKPILAHPERYAYWHNQFEKYEEIKDKKVLLQVNLLSFTGYYENKARKVAEKLIEKNMVSFLGSDCHRIQQLEMLNTKIPQKGFDKLRSIKILNPTL